MPSTQQETPFLGRAIPKKARPFLCPSRGCEHYLRPGARTFHLGAACQKWLQPPRCNVITPPSEPRTITSGGPLWQSPIRVTAMAACRAA